MDQPLFSVVIPAYNEEKYLPRCLDAVRRAEAELGEPVEIVVGNNMSTDRTAELAEEAGAKVVLVTTRCISAVRNEAANLATGKYLVFVDGDDMMSSNMLVEIRKVLESGKYVGGGVANMRMDRMSPGIVLTLLMLAPFIPITRVSIYVFYTTPEAYWAVGGFDEKLLATEDVDFAFRLKKWGKARGLKYKNLFRAHIIKSARKFDQFGDWLVFRHPIKFLKACLNNPAAINDWWYDVKR